jgi:hypothetical protein
VQRVVTEAAVQDVVAGPPVKVVVVPISGDVIVEIVAGPADDMSDRDTGVVEKD